jgi:glycosyltransferase involved in cell wall biosynthesis
MNPKFSVIITTFNRFDFLKLAVESVISQNITEFECFVVNAFFKDNVKIKEYVASLNDQRIMFLGGEKNLNGNEARNMGIKAAKSPLIAFLDDDDIWLPEYLNQNFLAHTQNNEVGLVYSSSIIRWDNNVLPEKSARKQILLPENVTESMKTGSFCPKSTSSVTVKKICFDSVGLFDENLKSFQDWDMWFRISKEYKFYFIEKDLFVFREHLGQRSSKTYQTRIKGMEGIIKKWRDELDIKKFRYKFLRSTIILECYNRILRKQYLSSLQMIFILLLNRYFIDFFKSIFILLFGFKTFERVKKTMN